MRELETKHCILRHLRADDAQTIFDTWASDPEVTKYLTWKAHKSVEETKQILDIWLKDYEDQNCFRYGIELKATGELIGMIDAAHFRDEKPEIGYDLGRKYWGHGYMTECLKAITQELFASGYTTILVRAADSNIGSNRVIQKNGYRPVGSRRERISAANPREELVNYYQMNIEDWKKKVRE